MASPSAVRRPLPPAWWLTPFLFAAWPALFLYAENIEEQITLEPLLGPLALSIAGTALLLATTLALTRSRASATLVTTLLVVLFFTYGHAWAMVAGIVVLHGYLLAAWGLVAIVGVVLILRFGRASSLVRPLLVVGAVLVVLNGALIAERRVRSFSTPAAVDAATARAASPGPRRDIYYVILDRYAGPETLERVYGWDNSRFLGDLEARGFYVAEDSTANYVKTAQSLLSSLNMDYLDTPALADEAAAGDDWTPMYRRLQGSFALERFLHDAGYRYVHLGLQRGATVRNSAADQTFTYGAASEFDVVLADTTLLVALEDLLPGTAAEGSRAFYRNQTLYQLDRLARLAETGGPKFVFAHLAVPHPPYVFNADGSSVTAEQARSRSAEEQFVEQVRFINGWVEGFVDRLMSGPDESDPIIIIQADEGPFPDRYAADEDGFRWPEATVDELRQKFLILNAYHLPGVDPEEAGLYPSITPVNSFRVVLNAYFGANLPLLPDRNLAFVDGLHIYDEVDVTARLAP